MANVGLRDRLKHAYNAFNKADNEDPVAGVGDFSGLSSWGSSRPDRIRLRYSNEKSIVTSIYTRIAIDVASVEMRHVRLDDKNRYKENIDSGLNNCLNLEANLDQAARAFRQDIATTIFDNGVAAIVPVDTSINPETGSFDIKTLRVGTVVKWHPRHITVSLYNEAKGKRQEILLEKKTVAIVENPLYSVMNEPNSTLQRLISKLNMLDALDEATSSGKLDLIVQLPYVIKSESRRDMAEQRRTDLEFQLKSSRYGIAYTDATEKITQLNRPAENNLLEQITTLSDSLYAQLGLTKEIMNGTADEKTMLNYMNRTVEPILSAITEAMKRAFLTPTARTQKQSVMFFQDPFKLVPISEIAEIADKLTRNEVLASNEIRGKIGFEPSSDPKADQLVNSNMPQRLTGARGIPVEESFSVASPSPSGPESKPTSTEGDSRNG